MNKKIIAIATTLSILGASTMLFSTPVNAKTNDNNVKQEEKAKKDEVKQDQKVKKEETKDPKAYAQAGVVRVTARSGGNIRSGAGMQYGKVATAPYGAEIGWYRETRTDSRGIEWYLVEYNGKIGWISSEVGELA